MQYRPLGRTGLNVSIIGLGGSMFGDVFGPVSQEDQQAILQLALKSGINYIDTAPFYGLGKAEQTLGKLLQPVPRDSYILSTKVGRYGQYDFDYTAERTIASVEESLERLRLDYIDIVQVHDIEFAPNLDVIISHTLPALEKLKTSGKIRHIGITGYPLHVFRPVIERSSVCVDTVMSYGHYCLFNTTLCDLLPFLEDKGIGVMNAAPLGMGLLTDHPPPVWHPAGHDIKQTCSSLAKYAQSKKTNIARMAVHFSTRNTSIATSVISSKSTNMLQENIDAALGELTDDETVTLNTITQRFAEELQVNHWEGAELAQYHQSPTTK